MISHGHIAGHVVSKLGSREAPGASDVNQATLISGDTLTMTR